MSQHRLGEVRARLQGPVAQRSLFTVGAVLQRRSQGRVTRKGERLAFLDGLQGLGQRPDVVVGESEGFDLGQFCLVRKCRQDESQFFEGHVQHVHAVALAVVGLCPSQLFDLRDFGWSSGRASSLAASAGLSLRPRSLEAAAASGRNTAQLSSQV